MLREKLIQVLEKAEIAVVGWGAYPGDLEYFTIVRPGGIVNLRIQGNVYVVGRPLGFAEGDADEGLEEFALRVHRIIREAQVATQINVIPSQNLRFDQNEAGLDRPSMLLTCESTASDVGALRVSSSRE